MICFMGQSYPLKRTSVFYLSEMLWMCGPNPLKIVLEIRAPTKDWNQYTIQYRYQRILASTSPTCIASVYASLIRLVRRIAFTLSSPLKKEASIADPAMSEPQISASLAGIFHRLIASSKAFVPRSTEPRQSPTWHLMIWSLVESLFMRELVAKDKPNQSIEWSSRVNPNLCILVSYYQPRREASWYCSTLVLTTQLGRLSMLTSKHQTMNPITNQLVWSERFNRTIKNCYPT